MLHWVFIVIRELSLVVVSKRYSLVGVCVLLTVVASLVQRKALEVPNWEP